MAKCIWEIIRAKVINSILEFLFSLSISRIQKNTLSAQIISFSIMTMAKLISMKGALLDIIPKEMLLAIRDFWKRKFDLVIGNEGEYFHK
jgi:hypothetical protein